MGDLNSLGQLVAALVLALFTGIISWVVSSFTTKNEINKGLKLKAWEHKKQHYHELLVGLAKLDFNSSTAEITILPANESVPDHYSVMLQKTTIEQAKSLYSTFQEGMMYYRKDIRTLCRDFLSDWFRGLPGYLVVEMDQKKLEADRLKYIAENRDKISALNETIFKLIQNDLNLD